MARRSKSLVIVRGDDYTHTVTITDETGAPIDCSAWEVTSQLRVTPGAAEPLAEFEVDDSAADEGVFVLSLDADTTRDLEPDSAATDVQRVLAGLTTTLFSSPVSIREDVTRG